MKINKQTLVQQCFSVKVYAGAPMSPTRSYLHNRAAVTSSDLHLPTRSTHRTDDSNTNGRWINQSVQSV